MFTYNIKHRLSRGARGGTHVSTAASINISRPTINTLAIEVKGKFAGSIARFVLHDDDVPEFLAALHFVSGEGEAKVA